MVDISDLLVSNSPYSKAVDFENFNETCVIKETGTDQYESNPPFIWLKFDELEKPVKLNLTMSRGIAANYGSDSAAWVGKAMTVITLPSQKPDGSPTNTINVLVKKDKIKAKKSPVGDDDIPFG
jgi:hypothetical protein